MVVVSLQLKQLVEQTLAAAAEKIFELLLKTIREYEDETQRQRTLLGHLLQPRVQLQRTELKPQPFQNKEVQHPEPPHVKEEKDAISIQLCGGLNTDDTAPPTEAEEASVSLAPMPPAKGALYRCSFCAKGFRCKYILQRHLLIHCGERVRCSICNKSFSRKDSLRAHMMLHKDRRTFSCSICNKSFARKYSLSAHMTLHSDRHAFSCSVCNKSFSRQDSLRAHMTLHSDHRTFSCSVCNKSFNRKSNLRAHMTLHSNQRPFKCSVCGATMKRSRELRRHLALHHQDKKRDQIQQRIQPSKQRQQDQTEENAPPTVVRPRPSRASARTLAVARSEPGAPQPPLGDAHRLSRVHTRFCKFCSKGFRWNSELLIHMRVHSGERPFSCPVCAHCFSCKSNLSKHLARHKRDGHFSCSVCNKSFGSKQLLSSHAAQHQEGAQLGEGQGGGQEKQLEDQLDDQLEDQAKEETLTPTLQTVAHPQPSRASVCALAVARSPPGAPQTPPGGTHRRGRVNTRFCMFCNKGFRCDSELLAHMRVHSGERPFCCPVCARCFSHKSNLNKHLSLHKRDGHFSCSVCGKRFSSKQLLSRHAAQHQEGGKGGEQEEQPEDQLEDKGSESRLIYCSI